MQRCVGARCYRNGAEMQPYRRLGSNVIGVPPFPGVKPGVPGGSRGGPGVHFFSPRAKFRKNRQNPGGPPVSPKVKTDTRDLSRLGELLNTLENVHFFAPRGTRGPGGSGGAPAGPPLDPPDPVQPGVAKRAPPIARLVAELYGIVGAQRMHRCAPMMIALCSMMIVDGIPTCVGTPHSSATLRCCADSCDGTTCPRGVCVALPRPCVRINGMRME